MLKKQKHNKVNKLTLSQSEFPPLLKLISDAPKELYVIGSLKAVYDDAACLAVIGSRKPTAYGRDVTESLLGKIARENIAIVSGLALGIDAIAHKSALKSGMKTIAVLPCGLDHIYPQTNYHLAQEIITSGGAIVSEYPPGTPPLKQHFIARNRIVSGLSNAVLITEAAEKSGTLHTANFALEQGRSVLAVPGNITSQNSRGTNRLIATGARPIINASDITDELGLSKQPEQTSLLPANQEEAIIMDLLASGVSEGKHLLESSQLETTCFNQTLTMLEISGKIKATGADNWSLQ